MLWRVDEQKPTTKWSGVRRLAGCTGVKNRVLSVEGTPTQLRLLDRKVASGLNAEAPNSSGRRGVGLGKRRRAARAVYHERGPGYDIAMFVCRPECDKSLVDDLNAIPDAFSVLVVR